MNHSFLPTTKSELSGAAPDFVFVTGDAYIDHPSFGAALLSRLLQSHGYTVAILAQPNYKTADDFKRIFDLSFEVLGEKKTRNCHIHFSKVMYGAAGEIKHLDFYDSYFGPRFEPLAEVLAQFKLEPVVICESAEIMAQDALIMKKIFSDAVKQCQII